MLTYYLEGGGIGHTDLLCVIGEKVRSRGLNLPGPGGGLSVEISRLTCQSHQRNIIHQIIDMSMRVFISIKVQMCMCVCVLPS